MRVMLVTANPDGGERTLVSGSDEPLARDRLSGAPRSSVTARRRGAARQRAEYGKVALACSGRNGTGREPCRQGRGPDVSASIIE